jgi:Putative adhesin
MHRRIGVSLASAGALLATGCASLVTVREDFQHREAWENYDRLVVRTLNGGVDLDVNRGGGDVVISGQKQAGGLTIDDAQQNLAELSIDAHADEANPRTLIVELDYPEALRSKNIGASLTIRVPQPVAVDIATGNGRIVARNVRESQLHTSNGRVMASDIDGRLEVRTSNGRVEAERIAGDATLESSNGSVIARTIRGAARVDTSNGNVEIIDAHGDIDVDTSNGSIVVDAQPAEQGRVSLVSSNGGIRATLPQTLRGELRVSTSNGSLNTNLGNATLSHAQWSKRSLNAQLNGGGAGQVLARTSNGSVTLDCR